MCGGELGGPLARVSLLDVSDLDVLWGRLLYLLGEFFSTCLRSSSLAGLTRRTSRSPKVSTAGHAPWSPSCPCVRRVAAPRAALGSGSQRARVQYGRRRLRSPALRKPQQYAQRSWTISSNTPALSHRCVCR